MRWLDDVTDSMDMNLSKLGEVVEDRGTWHAAVQEITKSQTLLSDLTATAITCEIIKLEHFLSPNTKMNSYKTRN